MPSRYDRWGGPTCTLRGRLGRPEAAVAAGLDELFSVTYPPVHYLRPHSAAVFFFLLTQLTHLFSSRTVLIPLTSESRRPQVLNEMSPPRS